MSGFAINGFYQQYATVKELKPGVTLEEAKKELQQKKDGLDSIGFAIGDKNYIAYGKGFNLQNVKFVDYEGKEGQVKFTENEVNSVREGVIEAFGSLKNLAAIGLAGVAGGLVGPAFGVSALTGVGAASLTVGGGLSMINGLKKAFESGDASIIGKLTK